MLNGKPSLLMPSGYSSHWKHRAVEATGGNQSLLGCFVLAICGWQHGRKPPRLGSKALINADGILITHMQDVNNVKHPNYMLGSVETVRDNLRGLADHLKLNDEERVAMFQEFSKWIWRDMRANQTAEERKLDK